MKKFLAPNISGKGRALRGFGALALLTGGGLTLTQWPWLGAILLVSGGFVAFEALRGWCLLRACGIKTRL